MADTSTPPPAGNEELASPTYKPKTYADLTADEKAAVDWRANIDVQRLKKFVEAARLAPIDEADYLTRSREYHAGDPIRLESAVDVYNDPKQKKVFDDSIQSDEGRGASTILPSWNYIKPPSTPGCNNKGMAPNGDRCI